jgi:NAD(P)-dependent dehydrogenase (short-subunit alcohol dehydrogenase family)
LSSFGTKSSRTPGRLGPHHQPLGELFDDAHRGRTPYGPSKAALESETQIWAQELAGTGVTVNAILPGGGTLTGMIPDSYPEAARKLLLESDIIVPPLLYLASAASDGVTGKRFNANKWRGDLPVEEAGLLCARDAGVYEAES